MKDLKSPFLVFFCQPSDTWHCISTSCASCLSLSRRTHLKKSGYIRVSTMLPHLTCVCLKSLGLHLLYNSLVGVMLLKSNALLHMKCPLLRRFISPQPPAQLMTSSLSHSVTSAVNRLGHQYPNSAGGLECPAYRHRHLFLLCKLSPCGSVALSFISCSIYICNTGLPLCHITWLSWQ